MKKAGVVDQPHASAVEPARVVKLGWFWYVIQGDRCLANGSTRAIARKRARL